MHSSRSYSKNKVPYQLTPEERYATFRAKIDLLNYEKRRIKHIWGKSSLSVESKESIRGAKFVFFVGQTCTYLKCTRTRIGQNGGMCPGQFLENGWKKQKAIYRGSSTAHAEFKSKNRSKIGSLYEEIFQHKCTVLNVKIDQVRVRFR